MAQAWRMLLRPLLRRTKKRTMKIHSTPHACYVSLRNGLTLELTFEPAPAAFRESPWDDELTPAQPAHRSCGVWMYGEEVLVEVRVGQA